jgi:hypothetical protein
MLDLVLSEASGTEEKKTTEAQDTNSGFMSASSRNGTQIAS